MLVLIQVLGGFSQDTESYNINFLHKPWSEVLEIAKQENKLIFVDCYTSWCGPCKMLATKIFTQKDVADFYNANFICVKYDMEKGEGLKLVKEFGVKAFPTLIIFNGSGDEMHRKMGAGNADEIIQFGQEAIDNKGVGGMTMRFKNGDRSPEFVQEYLTILGNIGKAMTADEAVGTLLNEQDKSDWTNADNWILIKNYLCDIHSVEEAYIRTHKEEFMLVAGEEAFNAKWNDMYAKQSYQLMLKKSDSQYEIDQPAFDEFQRILNERNIPGKDELLLAVKVRVALFSKNWDELVQQCDQAMNYDFPSHDFLNWASFIEQYCTDDEVRKNALPWVKHAAKLSDEEMIKNWSNSLLEKL